MKYYVNLDKAKDDGSFEEAVKAGSQVWEDDPDSDFDGEYIDTTVMQASGAKPSRQMDGFNVVDWGRTKHLGSRVIAVVVYWYYTASGEIVEADMRFNEDLSWSSNGGPSVIPDPDSTTGDPNAFDVQNIATHEFGHFNAGLKDLSDESENKLTMYGYGSEGELLKRTLGLGDQLSIRSAYPQDMSNSPPIADAGGSYIGIEDTAIAFDGSGSSDPDGDSLTYFWDFGDGTTSSGENPSHAYAWGGTFTVTLMVNDGKGGTNSDSTAATVTEVNDQPVADPDGPYSGTMGEPITFDGSGSYDPDNQDGTTANDQTLTYSWNFGDGATGTGVNPTHTYASAGAYTVTLMVNDGIVDSDSVSTTATVSEPTTGVSVTGITPDWVYAGQSVPVTITGTGFKSGASVSLEGGDGPTPKVSDVVVVDSYTIIALITTKSGGPPRDRIWDVRVNSDGNTGVLVDGFTVKYNK